MKRPKLRQWLKRTDDFDEVIFWRLGQFVRRTFPDGADTVSWAADQDIRLVSATEDLDLSGPMQRLMATMFASVAEMESVNTARRTAESREYLRRMKRWGGGARPTATRSSPIPTALARCWLSASRRPRSRARRSGESSAASR